MYNCLISHVSVPKGIPPKGIPFISPKGIPLHCYDYCIHIVSDCSLPRYCCAYYLFLSYAYQSLACETAINTEFSKSFSLKCSYVKYKNAILSHIDFFFFFFFFNMKGLDIFLRYLITTTKHTVKTETIKYLGKYMPICPIYMCQNSIL